MTRAPSEPNFVAVRDEFDIDIEQLRAMIPEGVRVKRMIIDLVLAQLPDGRTPAEALAQLGLDLEGVSSLDEISWQDYFSTMVLVAEATHGPEHLSAGLREIGRCFYRGVLATPIGRMLLGRQLGDAVRNVADTWAEFNTLGRVWSQPTGERSFDYHCEGFPRVLAESVGVGVFEGMFAYHFMDPTILIASTAPDNAILRMSW